MNTNNLNISLNSTSDDKLLNKFNHISNLFPSINFEQKGSNVPILYHKVDGISKTIRAIINSF